MAGRQNITHGAGGKSDALSSIPSALYGGGQVKYLVYRSPQPLRAGHVQDRTRVRRLYFPASATAITVRGPQTLTMRPGRQVYGVAVHYRHQLRGTTVHRDQTTYPLPPRWAER